MLLARGFSGKRKNPCGETIDQRAVKKSIPSLQDLIIAIFIGFHEYPAPEESRISLEASGRPGNS
jgi:hypothetical protein